MATLGARVASLGGPPRPGGSLGQGLVEYGLILALASLLAVLILTVFPDQVADLIQWIGRTVDTATGVG